MKIYQSRPQNNVHFVISNGIKGTIQCCFYNSNLSFDHFVSLSFSYPFLHTLPLSDHTTTKSLPPPTTCNVDDSSAISVNGYEDRLAIAANATGGQKAILAISEDNESAVIKYRSDQDMSSIGEYPRLPPSLVVLARKFKFTYWTELPEETKQANLVALEYHLLCLCYCMSVFAVVFLSTMYLQDQAKVWPLKKAL